MDVELRVDGGADEVRDLHRALAADPDLRGRVRLRHRPPEPGALGPVAEAVEVALAPGGALTVVAGAVLVWLRRRRGTVKVRVTRGEDTVEVYADQVRGLDAPAVKELTAQIVSSLDRKGESAP
ncbi:effector-associated constant component EACC1 [Saccharothrix variisporea]|uniref:Uncharacterized protein n=1 Tax=Saccharothrix variisporea TaxID=543527 RepID=A0A495XT56_9PSEU|nr:hypothetical protein [Saccharothrix variisporea]RKT74848.1 hypothetical protein DFJ66_8222 [Saccharothrix variisporea]